MDSERRDSIDNLADPDSYTFEGSSGEITRDRGRLNARDDCRRKRDFLHIVLGNHTFYRLEKVLSFPVDNSSDSLRLVVRSDTRIQPENDLKDRNCSGKSGRKRSSESVLENQR